MRRRQSPYLPRAMRNDHHVVGIARRTDHPAVGIKRQSCLNTSQHCLAEQIETQQLGDTHMTSGTTWTVEQDIQDRSTDREDVPRHATTAIYSDVTNLVTPGPKTADGLHRSYVATRPGIEAPHTLFASLTK